MTQPAKACPGCHTVVPLETSYCPQCGHQFRTQFVARSQPEPTQMIQVPPEQTPGDPSLQPPYPTRHQPPYPPPSPYGGQQSPYAGQQYPAPPPAAAPVPYQPYQQPTPYGQPPYGYPAPYPPLPGMIQKYPGTHSPALSVLLGLLLLGAGQFYNGQVAKGLLCLFGGVAVVLLTGGAAGFVIWPLALIDAAAVGGRLNRGEAVSAWQCF